MGPLASHLAVLQSERLEAGAGGLVSSRSSLQCCPPCYPTRVLHWEAARTPGQRAPAQPGEEASALDGAQDPLASPPLPANPGRRVFPAITWPTPCWPGLGCWDPSVILGEQNGDENQLSAPQKEAHLTGAQIVCPWGVLGCQLDTEGWPGPCSLYLGGGCRPGRRALSLSLTEFTRPSRWAALHSPRRTGLSSEEGR